MAVRADCEGASVGCDLGADGSPVLGAFVDLERECSGPGIGGAAGASCTFSVVVTRNFGGPYQDSTGPVGSTDNGSDAASLAGYLCGPDRKSTRLNSSHAK